MKKIFLTGFLIFFTMLSYAYSDLNSPEAIAKRIAPIGQVKTSEDTAVKPEVDASAQTVAAKPDAPRTGEVIYNQHCSVCHAAGVAGAPQFRNKTAWGERVKQGVDKMTAKAIKGFNAMPAKGTCSNCSDAEMKAAVEYMLPEKG